MALRENAFRLFETGFSMANGAHDLPSTGEDLRLSLQRSSSRAESFLREGFSELKLELLCQLTLKSMVSGVLLTGLQGGGLDLAGGKGIITCN